MQQKRPSNPYQVVWPVEPSGQGLTPERRPATVETPILLPTDVLLRHNARILDPTTATQPGRSRRGLNNRDLGSEDALQAIPYQPTAYVANEVLISAAGAGRGRASELAGDLNKILENSPTLRNGTVRLREPRSADLELADLRARTASPSVVRLIVDSDPDRPEMPADAWEVVQRLRDELGHERAGEVGLNHLMFASGSTGVGFTVGHSAGGIGFTVGHSVGMSEYAIPGTGGRGPVRWLARPPARREVERRPVIALLDTGVADHPWFDAPEDGPIVSRFLYRKDLGTVTAASPTTGGEPDANLIDPLEGLMDPFFGHGTFIAGIIRQTCPDAQILSVKVMDNDGIVEEADLINALGFIHQRQSVAKDDHIAEDLIDILSLSLGYYSEATAAGIRYDNTLQQTLESLGTLGILVVAAAGNNATTRPLLPAGFTPFRNGVLPAGSPSVSLISVGALNPDGGVALFSNSGDWIACYSPGAALVSTLPIVDAGQRSGIDLGEGPIADRAVASWRATIDPDSFTGFGTWSGTSFAAPAAAGAAAQALMDNPVVAKTDDPLSPVQSALASLGFKVPAAGVDDD